MTDTKKELNDEQLDQVTGGTDEGYKLASRDIINVFAETFLNNNSVMTLELANNCKQQVLGALYVYRNLGYIDEQEYRMLNDTLELEYQTWLARCTQ